MSGPTVEIENGFLRGYVDPTVGGKPYYSFKGIYFADPPVGPRRFRVRLRWSKSAVYMYSIFVQ